MTSKKYIITSFRDEMKTNYYNIHLKGFVYVERFHTEYLKKEIKIENWGSKNKRLYHYLDHSFRINLIHNNIKIYNFNYNKIAIFTVKLYKRNDTKIPNNELCILMFPSSEARNQLSRIRKSWFLSKDLKTPFAMSKMEVWKKYGIKLSDLPKYGVKSIPNPPSYQLTLHGFDKLFGDMLHKKSGSNIKGFIIDEFISQNSIDLNLDMTYMEMYQELLKPFMNAIKYFFRKSFNTSNDNNNNNNNDNDSIKDNDITTDNDTNNYIEPGIFWVTNRSQYKIMYHMLIKVIYRHKKTKFVAVLEKNDYNKVYRVVKVITLEMGLCNTRLCNEITGIWKQWSAKDDIIDSNTTESKDTKLELDLLKDITISEYPRVCEIIRNRSLSYNRDLKVIFDSIIETPINESCGHNHINFTQEHSLFKIYSINECDKQLLADLLLNGVVNIKSILRINHLSLSEIIVNEERHIHGTTTRITNITYYSKSNQTIFYSDNTTDTKVSHAQMNTKNI